MKKFTFAVLMALVSSVATGQDFVEHEKFTLKPGALICDDMEKFHSQNLKGNSNLVAGCIVLNDTAFQAQILKAETLGGIQYIGFSIPEYNVVMFSSSAQMGR